MKRSKWIWAALAAAGCSLAFTTVTATAQDKPAEAPKPEGKKDAKEAAKKAEGAAQDVAKDAAKKAEGPAAAGGMTKEQMAEMEMMMKMGTPGANHKLLEGIVGEWTYVNKYYQDPSAPPEESTGTATYKSIMGGRFIVGEHKGKFEMPGPDGKPQTMEFQGMGITGFDNAKNKFINTWLVNFGTMMVHAEGTYEPGTKTYTYDGQIEMTPGKPMKIREVIKCIDNDKHTFEWHEERGGKMVRTMEIVYSRKK